MIVASLIFILSCACSTAQNTFENLCPGPPSAGNVTGFTGGNCACAEEYYQTQAAANLTACVSVCKASPQCAAFSFGEEACYFFSTPCDGVYSYTGIPYSGYIKNNFMCTVIAPTNGAATVVGNGSCYVNNCTVNYDCNVGYNLVGASTGICNATTGGALSPPAPTCVFNATAAGYPASYLQLFEYEYGFDSSLMPVYIQLFNQWCAGYNSSAGITNDYQLQLNAYLLSKCSLEIVFNYEFYTPWAMNYIVMPRFESSFGSSFLRQYIIDQNLNVTAAVVKSYCQLSYTSSAMSIVQTIVNAFIYARPQYGNYYVSACFIQLIWAPMDIAIAFISWRVLCRVLSTHEMPAALLLKAEIICNLLWSLSYELISGNNLNLFGFIFAPFCFISPYMAVLSSTIFQLFLYFHLAFWSFGALVKSSIALERVLSLYFPVFYHIHANRETVSKVFKIESVLFWIGMIVIYVGISGTMVIDNNASITAASNEYIILVLCAVFITLIAFIALIHTVCACMIVGKLINRHSNAVVQIHGDVAAQKAKSERNISILVLSTTLLNLITYVSFICFLLQTPGPGAILSSASIGFLENAPQTFAAIGVDINVPLSLILQCIFCTPYRRTFIELYIVLIRKRLGSLLHRHHAIADSIVGAHIA